MGLSVFLNFQNITGGKIRAACPLTRVQRSSFGSSVAVRALECNTFDLRIIRHSLIINVKTDVIVKRRDTVALERAPFPLTKDRSGEVWDEVSVGSV